MGRLHCTDGIFSTTAFVFSYNSISSFLEISTTFIWLTGDMKIIFNNAKVRLDKGITLSPDIAKSSYF